MSKEKLTVQEYLALQMFQKPSHAIAKLRNKKTKRENKDKQSSRGYKSRHALCTQIYYKT